MTANRSSTLRLRADLIQRRVQMGTQSYWVLKDPLSREFYYFSDREYAILQGLDGKRDLAQITAQCAAQFAPDYVSADALIGFLADAKRKGLLDGCHGRESIREVDDGDLRRRRWWRQPLAIRFPGINPDRMLSVVQPWLTGLFSPVAAILAAMLVLVSAILVLTHFDAFTDHLANAASRVGMGGWIGLALVISATKIIHELAHALACKRFGGECREMGVMLLVGVPCLYCDVSDAWMLPERWKRVGISLAGIAAELVLASIAAWIWLFTADGGLRDLCVTVMVVCSVATVLFNGNPLLRYDGYFVLSDCVGIPNLAAESTGLIRQRLRQWVWGFAANPLIGGRSPSVRRGSFLWAYGVASGIYRVVVYGLILTMIYRWAESYELGNLVGCLILTAVVLMLVRWARTIFARPLMPVGRRTVTTRRPLIVSAIALVVLVIGLSLPLPHKIVASMSIRAAGAQTVFVNMSGQLSEGLEEGNEVSAGALIARLENAEAEREHLQQAVKLRNLNTELDGLRGRRASDPEAASRIPVLIESIAVTENRLNNRSAENERLNLRSPVSGIVFAPAKKPLGREHKREIETWRETPLHKSNLGAWLDEGTVLCQVGDRESREALVLVRQQDIPLVRVDQHVAFLLPGYPRGGLSGRVKEVSNSPVDELPLELTATGHVPQLPPGQEATYFQVRVTLDNSDTLLPLRTTGRARIHVGTASLATRIARFLGESFR